MDLIDRNYLLKNIISWGKLVKGNEITYRSNQLYSSTRYYC